MWLVPRVNLNALNKKKISYPCREFNHRSSVVLTVTSVLKKAYQTTCHKGSWITELPVYFNSKPNISDVTDKLATLHALLPLCPLLQVSLLLVTVAVAVAAVPVTQDVRPGVIPVLQRTEVRDEAGQFSLRYDSKNICENWGYQSGVDEI
jgi:hypothetical protein